nr:hypothetical protein [Tanacetum cinerariifolium]
MKSGENHNPPDLGENHNPLDLGENHNPLDLDNLDKLEEQLTKDKLYENDFNIDLTTLKALFERTDTALSKLVKESNLDSKTKNVHEIKYKMSKAKERFMAYFLSLHSHLQVLSKEDLKGTHIEHGFKRAFLSLFGQDDEISQNQKCKMKAVGQGMIQMLMIHISDSYMMKSQWLRTTSLDHLSSPEFELFSDHEEQVEEEITKTITEPTMKEYMTRTQEDYGLKIARAKMYKDAKFELNVNFLKSCMIILSVDQKMKIPHYSKDYPLKEEGKTLEEAYYTQFGVPFLNAGRYRAATPGFYQRDNGNPSYQERRQTMEESLSKFMAELAQRHDENSSLIKEIRASMDAAIINQGASIKAQLKDDKMRLIKLSRASVPFPGHLKEYGYDEKEVLNGL